MGHLKNNSLGDFFVFKNAMGSPYSILFYSKLFSLRYSILFFRISALDSSSNSFYYNVFIVKNPSARWVLDHKYIVVGKELFRRTRIYGKNQDRLYYSFQNDTATGTLEKEKSVFVMERDLDKAISGKVAEFITKATSKKKFIERVSVEFDEGL